MKRFEDYKEEVILAYEKKKKDGTLPPNLYDFTPANLRQECIAVFHNRYSKKDSETFKSLYEERNSAEEYLQRIKTSSADKFKPLSNFLKKNAIAGTHNRNIELLAWLIDFKPRPNGYVDIYEVVKSEQNSSNPTPALSIEESKRTETESEDFQKTEIIVESTDKEIIIREDTPGPTMPEVDSQISKGILGLPAKFNKTVIAFLAVIVVIFIIYSISPRTEYMYWDGKQYQSIAYNQKVEGAVIVRLDTFRLNHLKKITDLSLITSTDIGKIYYSKTDGKVEFYTTGGENPEDRRKRLLPMTEHMYDKYVLNKDSL